jgi:hypothetical protein
MTKEPKINPSYSDSAADTEPSGSKSSSADKYREESHTNDHKKKDEHRHRSRHEESSDNNRYDHDIDRKHRDRDKGKDRDKDKEHRDRHKSTDRNGDIKMDRDKDGHRDRDRDKDKHDRHHRDHRSTGDDSRHSRSTESDHSRHKHDEREKNKDTDRDGRRSDDKHRHRRDDEREKNDVAVVEVIENIDLERDGMDGTRNILSPVEPPVTIATPTKAKECWVDGGDLEAGKGPREGGVKEEGAPSGKLDRWNSIKAMDIFFRDVNKTVDSLSTFLPSKEDDPVLHSISEVMFKPYPLPLKVFAWLLWISQFVTLFALFFSMLPCPKQDISWAVVVGIPLCCGYGKFTAFCIMVGLIGWRVFCAAWCGWVWWGMWVGGQVA